MLVFLFHQGKYTIMRTVVIWKARLEFSMLCTHGILKETVSRSFHSGGLFFLKFVSTKASSPAFSPSFEPRPSNKLSAFSLESSSTPFIPVISVAAFGRFALSTASTSLSCLVFQYFPLKMEEFTDVHPHQVIC